MVACNFLLAFAHDYDWDHRSRGVAGVIGLGGNTLGGRVVPTVFVLVVLARLCKHVCELTYIGLSGFD